MLLLCRIILATFQLVTKFLQPIGFNIDPNPAIEMLGEEYGLRPIATADIEICSAARQRFARIRLCQRITALQNVLAIIGRLTQFDQRAILSMPSANVSQEYFFF